MKNYNHKLKKFSFYNFPIQQVVSQETRQIGVSKN